MRLVPLLLGLAFVACDSGSKSATPASGSAQPGWMIDLPRVVRTPALLDMEKGWFLIANQQGIVMEGKSIVPIVNGAVPAEYKEGGANGLGIERLTKFLAALPKDGGPLQLALERNLPYRVLVEILFSAKQKESGFKTFHLLVTDSAGPLAIPLTLPEKTSLPTQAPFPTAPSRGPASRVTVGDKSTTSETSLTPDAVLQKILSAYMAGIKRCYKNALTKNPAAQGKVTLAFTVNEMGRTATSSAKGFDAEIDDCIGGIMKSWVFARPKDKDGEATNASFSITLQLVPDDSASTKDTAKPSDAETAAMQESARFADSLAGGPEGSAPSGGSAGSGSAGPAAPAAIMQDPDRMSIGLVVTVTKDKLLVWSISGLEGTLSLPRLSVPLADATSLKQLNALMLDIVKRRWEGKDRAPATNAVIVMADPATTMQTIADVFVAVRSTADGAKLLFPDIELSVGFE